MPQPQPDGDARRAEGLAGDRAHFACVRRRHDALLGPSRLAGVGEVAWEGMKSSGREQGTQNRRSRSSADLAEGVVAILGNDMYARFRAEPERP